MKADEGAAAQGQAHAAKGGEKGKDKCGAEARDAREEDDGEPRGGRKNVVRKRTSDHIAKNKPCKPPAQPGEPRPVPEKIPD